MFNRIVLIILLINSVNLFSLTINEYLDNGEESLLKQDYYKSIDYFKEALRLNSNDINANRGLSDSFFMIGEYKEALIYIDVCINLGKNNLDIINRKGRILTALERYDEAKDIYDYVLSKEMYNIGAQSGLAELRIVTGDIKGSLYDFEKILKFSPKSRRLLLSISVLYDKQNEHKKSEVLIQKALRNYPGDPVVLEAAVKHYMASGDYQGASIYMDELSRVSDNNEVLILQAELQILLNQYDDAVKTLSNYMKEEKGNPKSYYLAAIAFNSTGKYKKAISLLKRGLDIKPDEEIYRFFKESIMNELYTLKDEKRGDYSQWYLEQGKLLEERFFYNKSKTYFLRGLDIDPLSYDLRLAYANILKRMDLDKRYLKELEIILEHYKDSSEVEETLMIEKSLPLKSIYEKWGDETFKKSNLFSLALFVDSSSKEHNLFSSNIINDISGRFLSGRSRFNTVLNKVYNGDFSNAFNTARSSESDFFVLISFNEGSRTFTLKAELYLTKSGRKIETFNYLKTGNNRVLNCFDILAKDLDAFFPLVGSVVDIRGDEVLLDAGKFEGVAKDSRFLVIKKGSMILSPEKPYVVYEDEKYLGEIVVSDFGESIAEGTYSSASNFNLLNVGDIIIESPDSREREVNNDEEATIIDTELIEQLLQVNF